MHPERLSFDRSVPHGGYAWWYVDALSDDGASGLTVIAFLGSVFSPYYAWARRRGPADPLNHCAFNVALYGPRAGRWAMTERGTRRVSRDAARLTIGPSAMHWDGSALTVTVDERCAPIPRRLRGRIRLIPIALEERSYALDRAGLHRWTPFAPCARIEVEFTEPAIRWSGSGYFDFNCGAEPLENAFSHWTWARASTDKRTIVQYDLNERGGRRGCVALEFTPRGAQEIEALPITPLPATGWRIARQTRADAGYPVRVVKTLEDAPFYSRSVLATQLFGVAGPAMHESLNLDRFRAPWVQCLLPFRMPRIA